MHFEKYFYTQLFERVSFSRCLRDPWLFGRATGAGQRGRSVGPRARGLERMVEGLIGPAFLVIKSNIECTQMIICCYQNFEFVFSLAVIEVLDHIGLEYEAKFAE